MSVSVEGGMGVSLHRLTYLKGIDSGGCNVKPPAFRPLSIFFTLSPVQPSSSCTRWVRSSVNKTATNSTAANFFPEHARAPSENGKKAPFAGFRIPWAEVVDPTVAVDEAREIEGRGTDRWVVGR